MKHNFNTVYLLFTHLSILCSFYTAAADLSDDDDKSFDIDSSADLATTEHSNIKATRRPFSYCNVLQFVNRSSWQAVPPDLKLPRMIIPVDKIFIDFTYSERCSSLYLCSFNLKLTQAYHKTEIGLFDIAYNFMIGDDSKVYIGRDFMVARAFDDDYNNNSLLIGIIGDYQDTYGALPRSLDVIYKLIRCGQEKGIIAKSITIYEPVADYCNKGPGHRVYRYMAFDRFRPVTYRCLHSDRRFSPGVLRKGLRIFSDNVLENNTDFNLINEL